MSRYIDLLSVTPLTLDLFSVLNFEAADVQQSPVAVNATNATNATSTNCRVKHHQTRF
jgi:hypothetical protein